jgi:hypothetical protein
MQVVVGVVSVPLRPHRPRSATVANTTERSAARQLGAEYAATTRAMGLFVSKPSESNMWRVATRIFNAGGHHYNVQQHLGELRPGDLGLMRAMLDAHVAATKASGAFIAQANVARTGADDAMRAVATAAYQSSSAPDLVASAQRMSTLVDRQLAPVASRTPDRLALGRSSRLFADAARAIHVLGDDIDAGVEAIATISHAIDAASEGYEYLRYSGKLSADTNVLTDIDDAAYNVGHLQGLAELAFGAADPATAKVAWANAVEQIRSMEAFWWAVAADFAQMADVAERRSSRR